MEKIVSFCGIICSECPAYLATKADDEAERVRVAGMWSEQYHANIKPEDIYCDGCVGEGRKFSHCNECDFRLCGLEKQVETCAHCAEYSCEKLSAFHQHVPEFKKNLDEIRQTLK